MAPGNPSATPAMKNPDGSIKRIPTAEDVSSSGGVWAPTSAKRDKLGELKTALEENQDSLDDAASSDELLDLYFADGLRLIVQTTDEIPADLESPTIQKFSEWLVESQQKSPEFLYDEIQFVAHLDTISEYLTGELSALAPDRSLREVRDFLDPSEAKEEELPNMNADHVGLHDDAFAESVLRFRLLLASSAVNHLKESWKVLTTVSDGDVDRKAVKGEEVLPQAVEMAKVYKFLFSHVSNTCSERVDSAWELIDRDGDGLLDESEMNDAIFLCVTPVQLALTTLFGEALNAAPARRGLPDLEESEEEAVAPAPGWRERRKESRVKKRLGRLFQGAVKNHLQDEVEISHRLRCAYAWAEKEHQGNKLDSVLVDEGWSGRKRYVELSPKISLAEFREVQAVHFTHLDRLGKEIMSSFREDLWVQQGKGRQNRELMRDCLAFLTAVSIADYLILMS